MLDTACLARRCGSYRQIGGSNMETICIRSILDSLQLPSGIHKAIGATYLTVQATYLLLPGQRFGIAVGILSQHILRQILLLRGRDQRRALCRVQTGIARVQRQTMDQAQAAGKQEKHRLLHVVLERDETLRLGHSPRCWVLMVTAAGPHPFIPRPRLDAVTGSSRAGEAGREAGEAEMGVGLYW